MTNKFTQNILQAKDNTNHDLRHLRNKDIVLLSGDKDSYVVIMNRVDYVKKVNRMINKRKQQVKYEMTTDTTHEYLEKVSMFPLS